MIVIIAFQTKMVDTNIDFVVNWLMCIVKILMLDRCCFCVVFNHLIPDMGVKCNYVFPSHASIFIQKGARRLFKMKCMIAST